MHRRRRTLIAGFTTLALLSPLQGTGAEAAGPPALGTAATTVTLITGDKVRLVSGGGLQIEPAPGREHVGFLRQARIGGTALSVLPTDAAPLVAEGLLDPRLFDVDGLVKLGYTDQARSTLPLIVTYVKGVTSAPSLTAAARALPSINGARRVLPSINGAALAQDKRRAGELWAALTAPRQGLSSSVAKVWLDGVAHPTLDASVPQIGAPGAWQAGYTGAGVTVGVLDTGVKADHPDLAGKVVEQRDFTDTLPGGGDDDGHGTHVAGTIVGSGVASGGKYKGVAPDAKIVSGKVCLAWGCPESAVIEAMEWIAPRARVVNMSLGGGSTDGTDPMSQAVNALTATHGTLFVVAAGNSGTLDQVSGPASADAALAVGSVTKQDTTSTFSSRGPRSGDYAVKPDVAAPGAGIVAARAAGTPTGDHDPVDAAYTRLSGTSMATPHVVGAAALTAQQHPDWTAARLKPALMSTAKPTAGVLDQGAGRVDVARAVSQQVTASSGSLSFGQFTWPHMDPVVTKTVTYRNDGGAPVTLSLALAVTGPDGQPAPAGTFTASASQVTVPANGTAEVGVSFDQAGRAVGQYSGRLTAAGAGVAVQTALAANLEPESYDLSIKVIGRNGTFEDASIMPVNTATGEARFSHEVKFDADGLGRIRLPKGRWDLNGWDLSTDPKNPTQPRLLTAVSRANVALDANTLVTLDATAGRPVRAVVDNSDATHQFGEAGLVSSAGGTGGIIAQVIRPNVQLFAVPGARKVTDHLHAFFFGATLAASRPGLAAKRPGTDVYNLAYFERGGIPADTVFEAPDRSLAAVDTTYHAQGAPASGGRFGWAVYPEIGAGSRAIEFQSVTVPSRRTEYFTARRDIRWFQYVQTGSEAHVSLRSYRPGKQATGWNRAPVGPAFGHPDLGWGVERSGKKLDVSVTLFSGSDPGSFTQPADGVTGTTTLSRNGVVIGTSGQPGLGQFDIPDEAGAYSLRAVASRAVPWSVIGTKTDVTWTFREHGVAAPATKLPLLTIRAAGDVDEQGRAPAGQYFPLMLTAQRQPGAPGVARLAELRVEASYDDGATWTPTRTVFSGSHGGALLRHPAGGGFVSLRIAGKDTAGNAVTQTVWRAYQLG